MRAIGFHPREVDELEVWEAARMLGFRGDDGPDDRPVIPRSVPHYGWADNQQQAPGPRSPQQPSPSIWSDVLAERVKAAKEGRPPPRFDQPR